MILLYYAFTSCGSHEASFPLDCTAVDGGDGDSNGRWSWLICDILARWPPLNIWRECFCVGNNVVPGIVGLDVVVMTSFDSWDADDVELMRVGEFIRILNGDICVAAAAAAACWFKWCWRSVWFGLPLDCWPLATHAATIADIAAFCGSWGWGRIKPVGRLYADCESVVELPVCDVDGVIPIGGECDAFSPIL